MSSSSLGSDNLELVDLEVEDAEDSTPESTDLLELLLVLGLMRASLNTLISSILKVFQFGLGWRSINLRAVTSCKDTRLSEAGMMIMSCDPDSVWGSGIRTLDCKLMVHSVADLAEETFLPILMPSVDSTPRSLAKLRVCKNNQSSCRTKSHLG